MPSYNLPPEALSDPIDPRAPMAAAPIVYGEDGAVAWDQMWGSFCVLASQGGPPHRDTVLHAPTDADPTSPGYQKAVEEIVRGIRLVSGLDAIPVAPGWIAIECGSSSKASWLSEQIRQENVETRQEGTQLWVPVGETFQVENEVKNVVTAVAKTTHYWRDHLAVEVKSMLDWEEKLLSLRRQLRRLFAFGK